MAVDSLGALFGLAPLNRFTFDGADALPPPVGTDLRRNRDADILAHLRARLVRAGDFGDAVVLTTGPDDLTLAGDRWCQCRIYKESWTESTEADGGAGLESTRTMRFVVEVWLQESDDERRFREIDRLEAVVCTVAQAPPGLAGAATVGLTQIVAGRNDPTVRNPWVCRMLAGQTSYLIPGLDARDRFADWG
jgi:hypothetical protein